MPAGLSDAAVRVLRAHDPIIAPDAAIVERRMKTIALAVYAVLGALGVILGLAALLWPELALPPDARSPLTAHLVREEGAEGVFVGLMAFWCLAHFEQRRPVHYALLVFAALFAAIHWAEYFASRRGLMSPLVDSVPFLLLGITAPWARAVAPARGVDPSSTGRGRGGGA
jgi:hypothetical protein